MVQNIKEKHFVPIYIFFFLFFVKKNTKDRKEKKGILLQFSLQPRTMVAFYLEVVPELF